MPAVPCSRPAAQTDASRAKAPSATTAVAPVPLRGVGGGVDDLDEPFAEHDDDEQPEPLPEVLLLGVLPLDAQEPGGRPAASARGLHALEPLLGLLQGALAGRQEQHHQVDDDADTPQPVPQRCVDPQRDQPRQRAEPVLRERPVEQHLAAGDDGTRRTSAARRRRRRTRRRASRGSRHGGGHDREAEHRRDQDPGLGVVARDVPVDREPGPRDPERQVEDGVQAERGRLGVLVQQVRQLADAGDDHQVEEQLLPRGVPLDGRDGLCCACHAT